MNIKNGIDIATANSEEDELKKKIKKRMKRQRQKEKKMEEKWKKNRMIDNSPNAVAQRKKEKRLRQKKKKNVKVAENNPMDVFSEIEGEESDCPPTFKSIENVVFPKLPINAKVVTESLATKKRCLNASTYTDTFLLDAEALIEMGKQIRVAFLAASCNKHLVNDRACLALHLSEMDKVWEDSNYEAYSEMDIRSKFTPSTEPFPKFLNTKRSVVNLDVTNENVLQHIITMPAKVYYYNIHSERYKPGINRLNTILTEGKEILVPVDDGVELCRIIGPCQSKLTELKTFKLEKAPKQGLYCMPRLP